MEAKTLVVLLALCCWCLVGQQARGSRLDNLRQPYGLARELDTDTQRKRRPLSSHNRRPEQTDYHFGGTLFRKRMFGNGEYVVDEPGYYAFEDE